MTIQYHRPVLLNEVIEYLAPAEGKIYVDCTFGGGGHTRAILESDPNCKVIALDWDRDAIEINGEKLQNEFPGRLTFLWSNFANIINVLKKIGITSVDGILADFGTSQFQIKEKSGFSVYQDSPLDMRMSPAHQKLTAAELINKGTEKKLKEIFWTYGEEKFANKIVAEILKVRQKKIIKTTGQLVDIVEKAVPANRKSKIHPATKIFQALRIYINSELENIHSLLSASLKLLKKEGRIVCISFHSLEDRMVKQFFKDHPCGIQKGFKILTTKAITAGEDELKRNPSSRSAKLRAAEVC